MSRQNKRQRERRRRQRRAEPEAGAPVIDDALCWHMVRTAPRLAASARDRLDEMLRDRGVTAFRPRAKEIVVRRGRRVVRHTLLLHRTTIVGVRDAAHLAVIAALPGISGIVGRPEAQGEGGGEDGKAPGPGGNVPGVVHRAARLDPGQLRQFMAAVGDDALTKPIGLEAGQPVVVLSGPFAHFPGRIEAILPHDRIRVAVSMFGPAVPVEMELADVARV